MSGRDPDGASPPSREQRLAVIDQLRVRIDDLDERLVELLNERAMCAVEIGHQKRALGLEVYQPGREDQVLDHVHRVCRGPLPGEAVMRVFERIIDEARRLERIGSEEE